MVFKIKIRQIEIGKFTTFSGVGGWVVGWVVWKNRE